jgi:protease I
MPRKLEGKKIAILVIDSRKPIAAICDGPWTLIEAGAVRNRQLTFWPSGKRRKQFY